MLDLFRQQYDRETLKRHIYSVSLIDLLKTQHIDETFAVRYLLSKKYAMTDTELRITREDVLFFQPHILPECLDTAMEQYSEDDDSVVDFETVSETP